MKPLWAHWWFLAAMALASAVAPPLTEPFRYRVAQLMKLERVRARISADLQRDDIGAGSLPKSLFSAEVARARLDEAHPAALGPLAEITIISREVVDSIGEHGVGHQPEVRSPQRSGRTSSPHACFAGDVLGSRDIQPAISWARRQRGSAAERRGPAALSSGCQRSGQQYRETFRCNREAHIDFELHARCLTLRVSDNGCGFDATACQHGNGLANIRRRANWLGGSAELRASPSDGTVITVIAPFLIPPGLGGGGDLVIGL